MNKNYNKAKTELLRVGTEMVAYRRLGDESRQPLLYLNHLAATLDNCDPAIMDKLAEHFYVIVSDYQGVGKSSGKARNTIEEMADDTIAFVHALRLKHILMLGFSLGGFVAQQVMLREPELVAKAILAGTGGAGGSGISRVPAVTYYDMARGFLTLRDPKYYLFFPMTAKGRAGARAFLERIH